jgi:predicted nucleic acid-binding protein
MNGFTVLLDSCVLYPAPLRDLLMHLTVAGLFRAKWTERIHEEWIRNLLANRPDLNAESLQRTRRNMDRHANDALVTGYEPLIDGLRLPDPNDCHVLAAAIRCQADMILTFNLKNFPPEALKPFDLESQHPDQFLLHQLSLDQPRVLLALKRQRELLLHPPKKSLEFLETLEPPRLAVSRVRTSPVRGPDLTYLECYVVGWFPRYGLGRIRTAMGCCPILPPVGKAHEANPGDAELGGPAARAWVRSKIGDRSTPWGYSCNSAMIRAYSALDSAVLYWPNITSRRPPEGVRSVTIAFPNWRWWR